MGKRIYQWFSLFDRHFENRFASNKTIFTCMELPMNVSNFTNFMWRLVIINTHLHCKSLFNTNIFLFPFCDLLISHLLRNNFGKVADLDRNIEFYLSCRDLSSDPGKMNNSKPIIKNIFVSPYATNRTKRTDRIFVFQFCQPFFFICIRKG